MNSLQSTNVTSRFSRNWQYGMLAGFLIGVLSSLLLTYCAGCTSLLFTLNPWLIWLVKIAALLDISGFGGVSTPYRLVSTLFRLPRHFTTLDAIGNPLLFLLINLLIWSQVHIYHPSRTRFLLGTSLASIMIFTAVVYMLHLI